MKKTDETLTAAGGWCTPKDGVYDLLQSKKRRWDWRRWFKKNKNRPVSDSLPSFSVARGGIKFKSAEPRVVPDRVLWRAQDRMNELCPGGRDCVCLHTDLLREVLAAGLTEREKTR